jgi:hypothetical protein
MNWKRVVAMVLAVVCVTLVFTVAGAEEDFGDEKVWVLCNPKSFVNIRENSSGRSKVAGRAECGDCFITDGVRRKGFLHVKAPVEAGDAWISERYIVHEEPVLVNETRKIESTGRVAGRMYVGGKRSRWLRNGDEVKVYWMAEWAITNRGFIRSEYIGERVDEE